MPVTRFLAVKFKDEYAGTDQKATQTREELYSKHLELYKSRPYVLEVEGQLGEQISGPDHGYHYAFLVKFESSEKVKYYTDEDSDHLEFIAKFKPLVETLFAWAFPFKQ